MAKVTLTGPVTVIRGKMGNMIFRQMPDGTIIVSSAPPKLTGRHKKRAKLRRSEKQKAHNSRFKEATIYARYAAKAEPIYAELAAVTPMKTAYNFALKDWFNPPVIERVERGGGCIRVQASDIVLVTKVQVTVLNQDGGVVERGEAVRREGDWWEFASQAEGGTVIAEAWDLPKNVTRFVLEVEPVSTI